MATFLILFECGIPTDLALKNLRGQCVNFSVFEDLAYIHGALNAATDWLFALLPIGVLYHSYMPRPTKISACVILAFAIAGSIASCVRTAYISGLSPTADFYQTATKPLCWTVVEPGLGITAASAATLRPLLRSFLDHVKMMFGSPKNLQSTDSQPPALEKNVEFFGNTTSDGMDLDDMEEMEEMEMPQSAWLPPKGMGEVHGLGTLTSIHDVRDERNSWDGLGDLESGRYSYWRSYDGKNGDKPGTANRVSVYEMEA